VSSSAWTVSPLLLLVVVAAIDYTMTSWLLSGRPRRFIEVREDSRCSISWHVEVPGGRRQTSMVSPGFADEGGEFIRQVGDTATPRAR
jgi:hypothetical protein